MSRALECEERVQIAGNSRFGSIVGGSRVALKIMAGADKSGKTNFNAIRRRRRSGCDISDDSQARHRASTSCTT